MRTEQMYKLCRLCLCSGESQLDIFDENSKLEFVQETVRDLLQFKVVKDSRFPWLICPACLRKLTDFRLFKIRCCECKVAFENRISRRNYDGGNSFDIERRLQEVVSASEQMEVGDGVPVIKQETIDLDSMEITSEPSHTVSPLQVALPSPESTLVPVLLTRNVNANTYTRTSMNPRAADVSGQVVRSPNIRTRGGRTQAVKILTVKPGQSSTQRGAVLGPRIPVVANNNPRSCLRVVLRTPHQSRQMNANKGQSHSIEIRTNGKSTLPLNVLLGKVAAVTGLLPRLRSAASCAANPTNVSAVPCKVVSVSSLASLRDDPSNGTPFVDERGKEEEGRDVVVREEVVTTGDDACGTGVDGAVAGDGEDRCAAMKEEDDLPCGVAAVTSLLPQLQSAASGGVSSAGPTNVHSVPWKLVRAASLASKDDLLKASPSTKQEDEDDERRHVIVGEVMDDSSGTGLDGAVISDNGEDCPHDEESGMDTLTGESESSSDEEECGDSSVVGQEEVSELWEGVSGKEKQSPKSAEVPLEGGERGGSIPTKQKEGVSSKRDSWVERGMAWRSYSRYLWSLQRAQPRRSTEMSARAGSCAGNPPTSESSSGTCEQSTQTGLEEEGVSYRVLSPSSLRKVGERVKEGNGLDNDSEDDSDGSPEGKPPQAKTETRMKTKTWQKGKRSRKTQTGHWERAPRDVYSYMHCATFTSSTPTQQQEDDGGRRNKKNRSLVCDHKGMTCEELRDVRRKRSLMTSRELYRRLSDERKLQILKRGAERKRVRRAALDAEKKQLLLLKEKEYRTRRLQACTPERLSELRRKARECTARYWKKMPAEEREEKKKKEKERRKELWDNLPREEVQRRSRVRRLRRAELRLEREGKACVVEEEEGHSEGVVEEGAVLLRADTVDLPSPLETVPD